MENKKQLSPEEISELTYLELLSYLGMTRHLGGLEATRELIELCQIDRGKYILDVGCGIGKTPCYIAKRHGCRVVGVDLSERMIDWSNERAKREGVEDGVEFRAADAQNHPFDDVLFDVVINESVLAFVENPQRALSEYVRVTKPGGYLGLNETTWIKTPPSTEVVEYLSSGFLGAKLETADTWEELLAGLGLKDIVVRTYRLTALSDFIDRIKWFGPRDILLNWYRLLSQYTSSSANRRAIKEMLGIIRNAPKNLYEYYGYGIYVGRKNML